MKTLLLKPCWHYPIDRGDSTYNRNWPPLSLLNCASLLRAQGLDVKVLDASVERLNPQQSAQIARNFDQVFITSASLDRWQCPNLNIEAFLQSVYELKKVVGRIFIMGTHGTVRPEEIFNATNVDALILGEPENAVVGLATNKSLKDIPGIVYASEGRLMKNEIGPDLDLANLPLPAYDLIDIQKYAYEVMGGRFALLEASRSCPYHCIFCVKSMYGKKYRVKSIPQFIKEIDYIIDVVKAENAYFIDLEFTVNRELVEAVCDHLTRRGAPITWCCQTRADSIDYPMLLRMKQAGCKMIHFGVETGSERIRSLLNKGISFERIEKGLKEARTAGLQTVCFFMFGLPTETIQDMHQTIRFAKRLNPTYASFHIALPYPGTDFYERVKKELDSELFPKAYTGIVSYEKLESIARRAFWSYYFRPNYIAGRLRDWDFTTFFKQSKFFLSYLKNRLWS